MNTIHTPLKKVIYQGKGIPASPPSPSIDPVITNLAQALLHGQEFSGHLFEKRVLNALAVKFDTSMMEEFQNALQSEMYHLAANPPKNEEDAFIWSAFLNNILAILPFTYPKENHLLHIPYLNNDSCELVEYKIEQIPLEPDAISPIISIGLIPTSHKSAPPILSLIGTTYPAASGFLASVMTDFHPFKSVGEHTYECSQERIDKWLDGKENVRVIGCSLGGALAFHTLQSHHQHLAEIHVFNPAGLYPECWKMDYNEGCRINIFYQPHDIVSILGSWPKGKNVNLYKVEALNELPSHNFLTSHIRAYTGCDEIKITKKDPEKENAKFKKKVVTFSHRCLGPLLIYLPCKLFYLICKLYLFIKEQLVKLFKC